MALIVAARETVPLVDLGPQHAQIQAEVREGFERIISNSSFILGAEVKAFERAYAHFAGVEHCVGVGNGTDALEMGLRAVGVGPGHEVIVPANSFIASALAVSRSGAVPVFADIDPDTYLVTPEAIEDRITAKTKAIMAVHLYGQMALVAPLRAIARRQGLAVIEDATQAHGAVQYGQSPGRVGVAATSFYPGKNLGCFGDGGAVLTDLEHVAERVRRLRDHGTQEKCRHVELGMNSRLDALQAVVLKAKLQHLPRWNEARSTAAARYDELLAGLESVRTPRVLRGNTHAWHRYVVRVPDRDGVLHRLRVAGIDARIHYPTPIHLEPAYLHLGYRRGELPHAEEAARHILSLPLFPHITAEQQERVVAALRDALP